MLNRGCFHHPWVGPLAHDSSVEKHLQEKTVEPQISPLRCAPVEMTKGRAALPRIVVAKRRRFLTGRATCNFCHLDICVGPNNPPLCHLDRSEAEWRDLRSPITQPPLRTTTALPFVISTGAKRSGEICGRPSPNRRCGLQRLSPLSSRPERSGVERSAVSHHPTAAADYNGSPLCHLDRSEAEWRDLRSPITQPPLRTTTALPFVISTGAKRSGEICGLPSPNRRCGLQRLSPLSSRPERSGVERSAVSHHPTAAADYNGSPLCHLDRSEAEWRDLRSPITQPPLRTTTALPFVISTG